MKALTWQGKEDVQITDVPDPKIEEPTDAIIKVTSTGLCGSDLHLYTVLGAFIDPGDVLGHEPMGIVEEVGSEVEHIQAGDRVVIPFNISCGHCWMCEREYFAQCETTQNRDRRRARRSSATPRCTGRCRVARPSTCASRRRSSGRSGFPMDHRTSASSTCRTCCPTAWQGVEFAEVPDGGTLAVFGLGPIGQMACRIARHRGHRVIGVDLVPERLEMARRYEVETIDTSDVDDVSEVIRGMTDGRGRRQRARGRRDGGARSAVREARADGVRLPPRRDRPAHDREGCDRPHVGAL